MSQRIFLVLIEDDDDDLITVCLFGQLQTADIQYCAPHTVQYIVIDTTYRAAIVIPPIGDDKKQPGGQVLSSHSFNFDQ